MKKVLFVLCMLCCLIMIGCSMGHTHSYDKMNSDENEHWKECGCGAKTEIEAHNWDNGVITKEATETEEGIKLYTCAVCGKTKEAKMDKLVPSTGLDIVVKDDYAILKGIGTCTDINIVVPKTFNNIPITTINDRAFFNNKTIESIIIQNNVTSIGSESFSLCVALKEVIIYNGVTKMGYNAFESCKSLINIILPDSITSIGNNAFEGCESLKSITLPKGLKTISPSMFLSCTALKSVIIPDGITSIGNKAFKDCAVLENVSLPNGITIIGDMSFQSCKSLDNVTLPGTLKTIGYLAFSKCAFSTIIIPISVTKIGNMAFAPLSSLTVYCEAQSKPDAWDNEWAYIETQVVWGYTPD